MKKTYQMVSVPAISRLWHPLFVCIALLAFHLPSFAGPRSMRQARMIAERRALAFGATVDAAAKTRVKSVRSGSSAAEVPAYYVFPNAGERGFVIVSGDDRLPEIVGYADRGGYDETSLPANYVGFMKAYEEMVAAMADGDEDARRNLAEVRACRAAAKLAPPVSPLLGDIAWNQGTPFNDMCPLYNGKDRAVTGCVATAMAQVMAYYRHPKQLLEDIPAYSTSWNGYALDVPAVTKSEGVYDWDNMLPDYGRGGYSQKQADAVAKLMYHCGAAVQMGYGVQSGARLSPGPLAKYFGYDADIMAEIDRASFTLAEWVALIDRELSAARPVFYRGSSSDGAHRFVCDGSDGAGLYHINWGWGGMQNGYFDITILNPSKGGIGSGNAPDGYNRGNSMIIGVAPDNGVADQPLLSVAAISSLENSDNTLDIQKATRSSVSEPFTVKIRRWFGNTSKNDFNGYLAYGIKDKSGALVPVTDNAKCVLSGMPDGGGYYLRRFDWTFDYAFPVGRSVLYPIYSHDGMSWEVCGNNKSGLYILEATADRLSRVGYALSAKLTADDEPFIGVQSDFTLTVTNGDELEYLGMLNVYASSTPTMPEAFASDVFFTIEPNSSASRTVSLKAQAVELYVWITEAETGRVLIDGQKFTATMGAEPVLKIVGTWNNATPGAYETERAVYGNYKVKAPRVDEDEAVFGYEIRNDGGTARLRTSVVAYSTEERYVYPELQYVKFPGGGQVTRVSRNFSPEELGGRTMVSDIWILDADESNYLDIPTTLPNYKLVIPNSNSFFNLSPVNMVVYVAGAPTGMSSACGAGDAVYGGYGEIIVTGDTGRTVSVYNLSGQKIAEAKISEGQRTCIPVARGLYIVDGKKILVK